MDTHALELLRKIYKKDQYQNASLTTSSLQWFISMQIDPGYWANEPLIKVGQKGGEKLLKEAGRGFRFDRSILSKGGHPQKQ